MGPRRTPPPRTKENPPGPGRHPPGKNTDTVNERPVRILLECILVIILISPVKTGQCKIIFNCFQHEIVKAGKIKPAMTIVLAHQMACKERVKPPVKMSGDVRNPFNFHKQLMRGSHESICFVSGRFSC